MMYRTNLADFILFHVFLALNISDAHMYGETCKALLKFRIVLCGAAVKHHTDVEQRAKKFAIDHVSSYFGTLV